MYEKYKNQFNKEHYDVIKVIFSKEEGQTIREIARSQCKPVSRLLADIILRELQIKKD